MFFQQKLCDIPFIFKCCISIASIVEPRMPGLIHLHSYIHLIHFFVLLLPNSVLRIHMNLWRYRQKAVLSPTLNNIFFLIFCSCTCHKI